MLPVAHTAVGVLAYLGVQIPRDWTAVSAGSVLAALVGSQFADVIDKPLAYYGVLPSGRSLAHSLFVVVLLGIVLYVVTPAVYRKYAFAFWVAAFSHPFADGYHSLLSGESLPGHLFYPLTRAPRFGDPAAPWTRLIRIYSQPTFEVQTLALVAIAVTLLGMLATVEAYDVRG